MKILVVKTYDGGLWYHRLFIPFLELIARGVNVTFTSDYSKENLSDYNVIVFQRHISLKGDTKLICDRLKGLGLKIVFDIDDYWDLPSDHKLLPYYRSNKIPQQVIEAFKCVDVVTTTTNKLASFILPYNKNVYVLPNAINTTDEQWNSEKVKSDILRFGYVCGVHHSHDAKLMKESCGHILRKLNVQLLLGGFNNESNGEYESMEAMMTDGYNYLDKDYLTYLFAKIKDNNDQYINKKYRRLWALDYRNYGKMYDHIDVSLVPLRDNLFNSCKSELKLVEAATKGCGAIVSKVEPYSSFPEEAVEFVDDNSKGWFNAVKRMSDKNYRDDKVSALKDYVNNNYNLDSITETRLQIFNYL